MSVRGVRRLQPEEGVRVKKTCAGGRVSGKVSTCSYSQGKGADERKRLKVQVKG